MIVVCVESLKDNHVGRQQDIRKNTFEIVVDTPQTMTCNSMCIILMVIGIIVLLLI